MTTLFLCERVDSDMKLRIVENEEDWFVIDDTRKSRFYDYESLDDAKRLAKFYYKNYPVSTKFNTVIDYITKDLTPNHSKAFIAEVISYVDMLRGNKKADPYELALYYFDKSSTDKEIENDLLKQGCSRDFIMQVFDYIDEFSS